MLSARNTYSADEVYSSLHGCAIVLLVLSILHCLMLSGVLGIITASIILCCVSRPGPAGIVASGNCIMCSSITTAAVAGVSFIIAVLLAVSALSLQPPIAEACMDCDTIGPGAGDEVVVPFGTFRDFEATRSIISDAAGRSRENATDLVSPTATSLVSERFVPFGVLAEYPFSTGLVSVGRAVHAVLSPLTPVFLAAERENPVVRAPSTPKRRRLKKCVPESGPLEGQPLTRDQCDELLNTTGATFFWCFFNSLFELGILVSASLVASKVRQILSLMSGMAPLNESSGLIKR
jgi:hypothetical protein